MKIVFRIFRRFRHRAPPPRPAKCDCVGCTSEKCPELRRRMFRLILGGAAILAAIFVGCSGPVWVKPTPAGEKVRVTNSPPSSDCKLLGPVIGTGFYGPDDSIAIVQNKTAELGGNVVVIITPPSKATGTRGEAYSCP